jgi:hypothetical protein
MMLDGFQQARLSLPNMPEEIFQLWLDERIKTNGWPPAGIEWGGFLRSFPLAVWQRLEWFKADVDLKLSDFTSDAQYIFGGLAAANILGQRNEFSLYLGNSKSRIQSIGAYLRQFRALPSILILIDCGPALEVVDGFHRLATFFFLKANGFSDDVLPIRQRAWVGRYPGLAHHATVHPCAGDAV